MNALLMAKLVEAHVLLSAAGQLVAHAAAASTSSGAFDEHELTTLRALHVAVLECGAMVRGRMVACETPTTSPTPTTKQDAPAPLTKRPVQPYAAEEALGATVDTTA